MVRNAGIKWLCLGIESGDKKVRLEVAKGKFEDVDVRKVIKKVFRLESLYKSEILIGTINDKLNSISRMPNRLEIALRFIRF